MRRRLLLAGLALGILAWAATWAYEGWRYGSELRRAGAEIRLGRYGSARPRLAKLSKRWPGRGDADYWLGECDEAEGRVDEALEDWARVPPELPGQPGAAVARGAVMRRARL